MRVLSALFLVCRLRTQYLNGNWFQISARLISWRTCNFSGHLAATVTHMNEQHCWSCQSCQTGFFMLFAFPFLAFLRNALSTFRLVCQKLVEILTPSSCQRRQKVAPETYCLHCFPRSFVFCCCTSPVSSTPSMSRSLLLIVLFKYACYVFMFTLG